MKRIFVVVAMTWLTCFPAYGMDLLEVYELAVAGDPALLQMEAKRNATLKNKPISLAKLLPQVSFYGDFREYQTVTGKSPITAQANTNNSYWLGYYTLRLTQPLFHYDSWVQYWQADMDIAQAQANLEAAYQDVAIRVAKAYFTVLFAEENLEFTTVELQSLDLQLAQVKERLAAGFATVVDESEAQAQRDKIAADLILAEQQLYDAKQALREIIGPVEISLMRVPAELQLAKPEPADVEAWHAAAQQSNLGILAASSGADAAKQNIDLYFAGHMPTVDLVAFKGYYNNNRPNGVAYDENNVGVAVNVPLFSGGGVNAKVEQARDAYEQALHEVDKQRRAAERQVRDAYRGVMAAIGRVEALKTALKSAQTAFDASQFGFQAGSQTMVDVIIMQSRFFAIRRDYARARYDYLVNGLVLKQAAGTLTGEDMAEVNFVIHGGRTALPTPSRSPARRGTSVRDSAAAKPTGEGTERPERHRHAGAPTDTDAAPAAAPASRPPAAAPRRRESTLP